MTARAVRLLDQHASDAAYDRWAPVYDLIFNLPFQPGRIAATAAAARAAGPNGEILVVGVGTGLELPLAAAHGPGHGRRSQPRHARCRPPPRRAPGPRAC